MQTFSWFEFMLGFFSFLLLRPVIVSVWRSVRRGRRRFRRNRNRIDYERYEREEREKMMRDPALYGLKIFIGNTDQVCREYDRLMNPVNDLGDKPDIEFMVCPQWQDERGDISYNGIMMVVRYYYRPAKFQADPA